MRRLTLILILLLLPAPLRAFIPDWYIVAPGFDSHVGAVDSLSMKFTEFRRAPNEGKIKLQGRAYSQRPGKSRVEWDEPDGLRVLINNDSRYVERVNERTEARGEGKPQLAFFWHIQGRSAFADRLDAWGIDRTIRGLGRRGEDVCVTFGAEGEGDPGRPQAWLGQNHGTPCAIQIPTADTESRIVRVEFYDWQLVGLGAKLPRHYKFFDQRGLYAEWYVDEIEINGSLEPSLFLMDAPRR